MKDEKVFFQWPWNGPIYMVQLQLHDKLNKPHTRFIRLPNKQIIQLELQDDYFPFPKKVDSCKVPTQDIPNAILVVTTKQMSVTFKKSWEPIIPLISAAALVNTLFHVTLTKKEYERLVKDNNRALNELLDRLPERARGLIHLYEKDPYSVGSKNAKPTMELYRTCGGCPH